MNTAAEMPEVPAEVKKRYGKHPSKEAIRIANLLLAVGDKTEAMGVRDKQAQKQATPPEIFIEATVEKMKNYPEEAALIGEFLAGRYADGYQK